MRARAVDRLLAARTVPDILAELARSIWANRHDGAECPTSELPTEADLARIWPDCPDPDRLEVSRRLTATLGFVDGFSRGWVFMPITIDAELRLVACPVAAPDEIQAGMLAATAPDGEHLGFALGPRIEAVHETWADPDRPDPGRRERPRHPLAPIVQAWQARPRETEADRRDAGILPAPFIKRVNPRDLIRAAPGDILPDIAAGALPMRRPDPSGQLWLPGLDIDVQETAAFIIAILDAGSASVPGAGAPLRDRFFAELLMSATTTSRPDGERHRIHGLTVADAVEWAGWNARNYRPDRADLGMALERALRAVNTVSLPMNNRGGWLIPVFVEALEGRALSDRVAANVRLPPGSEHGARVHRPTLRQAGRVSAIAWRLYLSLCFEWNRIAHKGRTPNLTRPARRRNKAGYLVDTTDKVLVDRRGRALKDGPHARSIETGEREPNPAARFHRIYDSPGELVRMAYPLGVGVSGGKNPGRTEDQCVKAIRWLAGETDEAGTPIILNRQAIAFPALRIERLGTTSRANPHGFPWRIVPPWTR